MREGDEGVCGMGGVRNLLAGQIFSAVMFF